MRNDEQAPPALIDLTIKHIAEALERAAALVGQQLDPAGIRDSVRSLMRDPDGLKQLFDAVSAVDAVLADILAKRAQESEQ